MASSLRRSHLRRPLKRGAQNLAERLARSGIKATAIHRNESQSARQRALAAFQRKQIQVLVATDIAARGIDVDGITHVVNFDLPGEPESYVHRIGRTGRAGAEGIALSFCSAGERRELRAIEELMGTKVPLVDKQPRLADKQPQPERREHMPSVDAPPEENRPNQKRRMRRKDQNPRQRVNQSS